MKTPIYFDEKTFKRKIDQNSKFILIGNNIDGSVNFEFSEFDCFEQVKEKLPQILFNIKGYGEWNLSLYQVDNEYKITKKYGYYKYPKKGKLLFSHTYMNLPIKDIQFKNNEIIFIGCQLDVEENWNTEEVFFEKDLMIEVTKLILN